MPVKSVRFNEKESEILKKLSAALELDQSTVIKKMTKFHGIEQILGS